MADIPGAPVHIPTIVIGAGVGGCFTAKELHEKNQAFRCFETLPRAGGVYVKYSYDDFHFTTSTQTAAFGDFPWREKPQHWSVPQFLAYLDEYIAHFDFKQHIRFNAKVEEVTQTTTAAGTKVWRLVVHYKSWNHLSEFPLTTEEPAMDLVERREVYTCDHIVAATGTHNKWQLPKIPGREQCAGRHFHSSEFHRLRRSGELAGRHVLLVGLGESGCDLAKLAAAAVGPPPGGGAVSICVPRHSGVYYPREFEGSPADTVDSRLLYGSARWPTHLVVRHTFRRRFLKHSYDKDAMATAAEVNYQSQRTPMNSFGVKTLDLFNAAATCSNVRMVPAAVQAFEADGTAVFSDGTKLLPDVVIFCTGYALRFPYFNKTTLGPGDGSLEEKLQGIRSLWKHSVLPEAGDSLFLVGFARPNMTSLFIPTELQARLVAGVIAGDVELPPRGQLVAEAAEDAERYRKIFSEATARRVPALVDHLTYNDGLAEFLGASPPLVWALFPWLSACRYYLFDYGGRAAAKSKSANGDAAGALRQGRNDRSCSCWPLMDIELFVHLLFGPLNSAHYRFSGSQKTFEAAVAAVKGIPLHHNYIRACLQPHLLAVNFAYPLMMLLTPFFGETVAPVGRMKRAVPLFWSAVGAAFAFNIGLLLVAASSSISSSPFDGIELAAGISRFVTIASLSSSFIGALKAVLCAYLILGNTLIGAAFYFSPPSTPYGTRMAH